MPDSPPPGEIFHFPDGLPGFELHRGFLLSRREGLDPLLFLDSTEPGGPGFIAVPIEVIQPDYRLVVDDTTAAALQLPAGSHPLPHPAVLALALLTFTPDQPPTANLLAPVVLNPAAHLAAQVLQLDSGYSVTHPLHEAAPCS